MTRTWAKGRAQAGRRASRRPDAQRAPTHGRPPRDAVWLLATAVAVVAVVAVLASRGGGGDEQSASSSAGFVGGDLHSLVVDPVTTGRLFVGGHDAVSTSADGGRTWSRVESLDGADAMGWAFTTDTVYVSGHPGVSRSSNGAAAFRPANDGLPDTDVHAFGAGGSTLYAGGPAIGVMASSDGGRTWEARTSDAGQAFFGRILTGPDDDQHLVAADARSGATESTDGGRTWRSLGGPRAVWVSRSGTTLYVSGPEGAGRSPDGGTTWEELALPAGASLVEADPGDPAVVYAGIHDGGTVRVMVSRDGGARWEGP